MQTPDLISHLSDSDLASEWIDRTLSRLTLGEAVGQLLCPEDRKYTSEDWNRLLDEIPLGSVFLGPSPAGAFEDLSRLLSGRDGVPVLLASDLEHGAGCMIAGCTDFPWQMALGACDCPDLAYEIGLATGQEGRAYGVHWTFSPVVDLNLNFQNPVTNVRSLGDDPRKVADLASALVRGIQANGQMAACAKHFPGDGVDDRDQHICTSVNSLVLDDWWRTYGGVWQRVIAAGLMSVMSGHIAFPAYQREGKSAALPATLSRQLQVDLLRGELGFDGVIVSDAAPMIGLTSRVPERNAVVENIRAGSDVFLFANPRDDFYRLMQAVETGELSEDRVYEAARRVLGMKAKLGLHIEKSAPRISATNSRLADEVAERSITIERGSEAIPARLVAGDRVLTVTIRYTDGPIALTSDLAAVDEELRARGLVVDHLENPDHGELIEVVGRYKAIFVNFAIVPHQKMGTIRLTGNLVMTFWRGFWLEQKHVVFTSFGSPYHLYELPHLPNMIHAYGISLPSQRAAVKVWLGEIPAQGILPVRRPDF